MSSPPNYLFEALTLREELSSSRSPATSEDRPPEKLEKGRPSLSPSSPIQATNPREITGSKI